ncbi:MAG: PAS domain S-box protein [Pirellulaceae bacterium]|nr:PAS domain S-box protein [Planctomycetales bacterium]
MPRTTIPTPSDNPELADGHVTWSKRLAVLLILAIFAVDSFVAVGIAGYVLYLPVFWLAYATRQKRFVMYLAAVCSLLIALDLTVSPPGGVLWRAVVNHVLAMMAIWFTALLCIRIIRSERLLREGELYSQSIVATSLDAVISMDHAGIIIGWNEQAEQLFGWKRAEVIGKSLAEHIIPEDQRAIHREGLRRYLETGKHTVLGNRIELLALRRDGNCFPAELSIAAISRRDGVFFSAFLRDITERQRAMAEVRRNEERVQLLLASTEESIYGVDMDGICTFCNPACVKQLGYQSESDLLGRNMHELVHHTWPNGTPYSIAECQIYEASRQRKSVHVDNEFFWRKDGTSFPVEYRSNPIIRDGQAIGAVVAFSDITARKEAARNRSILASIINSSHDAVIGKGRDNRIISWNAGAVAVYGYSAAEAIGQNIDIILPLGAAAEEPEIQDAVRSGNVLEQFETVRRHKQGHEFPVSLTVSPIRDEHGIIIGSSTIERDVTEQQRREQELQEAKECAEQANRTRGEFLANVSHELRTPMNAILGMTQLGLQETGLSSAMRDYLETAHDSAQSLLVLLNDILDFSKLESGKFSIEDEPFAFREAIDDALSAIAVRAFEKGIELICDIAPTVPDVVIGDVDRVRQILLNIVGNAVKFTSQGEVLVHVEPSSVSPSEAALVFHIRDTGIGISQDDQRRIFEPFVQADASSTRQYGGTGLGLAICVELLRLMGGVLQVDSIPDKGSHFQFTIRFRLPDDAGRTAASTRFEDLDGLKVMVVDDNRTNLAIVEKILQNWSMTPTTSTVPTEALSQIRTAEHQRNPFQLVILDAAIPGVDVPELTQTICETSDVPIPIIVMASPADRQVFTGSSVPIAEFVRKPVSQSSLLDAIMASLKVQAPHTGVGDSLIAAACDVDGLRVLVAEDTPANQKVVKSILQKRGYHVEIAENGREALELLTQNKGKIDVVLMDVQMPVMDGFQATAAIRSFPDSSLSTIPIVAMTAHAMRGDRERCLRAGMDAYISKPIDMSELVNVIHSVHRRARPRREFQLETDPESDTGQTNACIDLDAALDRLGGDRNLLAESIGIFLDDYPELLSRLTTSLEQGNEAELRRAAHSLRGLAASFNATHAMHLAAKLEGLEPVPVGQSRETALHELQRQLARVEHALRSGLNQSR